MQDLSEAGGQLPDAVVERIWNIIQALDPGSKKAGAAGGDADYKPHPKARPGAAIPGLALQNTRQYAKQLDHILLEEADRKPKQHPAEQQPENGPAAAGGSSRDRDRDKKQDRDRDRDRDKDRDRDRDRDSRRDRSKDRQRQRSTSRDRRRR